MEVQHHGCHLLNIGPQSQSPDRLPDLVRASGVVFRLGLGLRLGQIGTLNPNLGTLNPNRNKPEQP